MKPCVLRTIASWIIKIFWWLPFKVKISILNVALSLLLFFSLIFDKLASWIAWPIDLKGPSKYALRMKRGRRSCGLRYYNSSEKWTDLDKLSSKSSRSVKYPTGSFTGRLCSLDAQVSKPAAFLSYLLHGAGQGISPLDSRRGSAELINIMRI